MSDDVQDLGLPGAQGTNLMGIMEEVKVHGRPRTARQLLACIWEGMVRRH